MGWVSDTEFAPDPVTGVITVLGRRRLPSDVVGELMEALAGDARVVVCDLREMAVGSHSLVAVFAPVAPYLANWPGTAVVVCLGRVDAEAQMLPTSISYRLLVHQSPEQGVDEARQMLRPLQHTTTYLAPTSLSAPHARGFAMQTVRDWGLGLLTGPVGLVVSELVTHSLLNAKTVQGLSLSRCDDRLRIAVADHGGGRPTLPTGDLTEEFLKDRGMLVVQALTRSWGIFPAHRTGKTVWAVMDAG